MGWFILAVAGMLMFVGLTLIQKHLLNLGIHPIIFGLYLMGFTFITFLITSIVTKQKLTIPSNWIIFLVIAAIFALVANITATYSFQQSPNPGYTQAIVSASGVGVLIGSVFLFSSEITLLRTIGLILTTLGVILIGWK